MLYKSIYQIDGTQQEDIDNALRKAGFKQVPVGRTVPETEIRDIINTLDNIPRRRVFYGQASIVPTARSEFHNGADRVIVDSFNIVENATYRYDPVIFVFEEIPGRTSTIVEEILEEQVTIEIIKSALMSTTGKQFKTSVYDLARLKGEDPRIVYNRCIKTLISSCVSGFKRIAVDEQHLMSEIEKQWVSVKVT